MKIKAKKETEEDETGDKESRAFKDLLIKSMNKNEETRKELRKSLLEDLLKNDEDEDVKIYSLIELLVEKNNQ